MVEPFLVCWFAPSGRMGATREAAVAWNGASRGKAAVSTQADAPCWPAASLGSPRRRERRRVRQRSCQSGIRGNSCRYRVGAGPRKRRGSGRSRSGVSWAKRRTGPWRWRDSESCSVEKAGLRIKKAARERDGSGGCSVGLLQAKRMKSRWGRLAWRMRWVSTGALLLSSGMHCSFVGPFGRHYQNVPGYAPPSIKMFCPVI